MSLPSVFNQPITNPFGRFLMALACIGCGVLTIIWFIVSTHTDRINATLVSRTIPLKYDVIKITIGKSVSYGICERDISILEAPTFDRWSTPLYLFATEKQALRSWLELVGALPPDPVKPVATYKIYESVTGETYNH